VLEITAHESSVSPSVGSLDQGLLPGPHAPGKLPCST
jgi:hypothetical protein